MMTLRSPCCFPAVAVLLCAPVLLAAQEADPAPDPHRLRLATEKVVVFKDGYALVLKRGTAVTDENGEVYTNEVPDAAVLGSFWATPREGRILHLRAGWSESTERLEREVGCTQIIEVLAANVGRACEVKLADGETLSGEIRAVLSQDGRAPVPGPLWGEPGSAVALPPAQARTTEGRSSTISTVSGTHFVLATANAETLVAITDVRRLDMRDMRTTLTRTIETTQREKLLTLRFAEPGVEREVLLSYFRPGVRWIPTYTVRLPESGADRVARVRLQAEIINEAEDFVDAPIDVVVGVPNFRFRTVASPLVLEGVLRNALNEAAPQLMGQFRNDFSNALYAQRAGEVRRGAAPGTDAAALAEVELPDELGAARVQELFVYNLPPMTLRRGERSAVGVLAVDVPYRDVYTWNLHLQHDDDRRTSRTLTSATGIAPGTSPLVLSQNEVWRQIELTNTTDMPWTTGAAMLLEGERPLAQELLTYTSPAGRCRVPVTVAVDLRPSFSEEELARDLNALSWNGAQYAKISQRASLEVRNHKGQSVDLEITLRFGGKAESVVPEAETALAPFNPEDWAEYRGHPAVNNSTVVRWTSALAAGETFATQVDYHFYLRN